jgi:5-methylthioadenosine/S-adenosylhomocysteine deaminase
MLDLLIKNARYIITSNQGNEIIEGASIGINDGKIAYIGTDSPEAKEIYDATNRLISPGFINSHTHLGMSLLRGWAEGVNLQGFLERVWAAEGAIMDEATCELGTELGALEALLSGTTTTMDMYLNPVATHRGAVRVGLRHIAGPIFFDFPGLDGLQWEQRIERAYQWPAELAKIGGPFIPTYLMPHSTYTDSPENLTQVAAIAKELQARIHLHVSETEAENADVQSRYSKSPTEVCRDTGILDVPTIFGHGVHLSDSDMVIASSKGTSVGHCPGSNLKLGSGLARFNDLRKAGIAVGLGTDSCSSSNDLDMFSVMRMAAHVVALRQSPADVDLTAIVRAATIEAAKAVGLDDRVGSIEIGKEADLIALDLHAAHLTPVHDVNALLVFAAGRGDVTDVWVAGDQVVSKRVSTKVDLNELIERVNLRVKALDPLK